MPNVKCGYPAKAVSEFITEQFEEKPSKNGPPANYINGRRVTADHQRRIREWRDEVKLANLAVVDRMLMHYDLALWEYESWATERFGSDTFYDHDEAVAALTA